MEHKGKGKKSNKQNNTERGKPLSLTGRNKTWGPKSAVSTFSNRAKSHWTRSRINRTKTIKQADTDEEDDNMPKPNGAFDYE